MMYKVYFCGLSCHSAETDESGCQTTALERGVHKYEFGSLGEAAEQFSRWAKWIKSLQTVLLVGPGIALAAGEPHAPSVASCRVAVPPNSSSQRWVWRRSLNEHADDLVVAEMNKTLGAIHQ